MLSKKPVEDSVCLAVAEACQPNSFQQFAENESATKLQSAARRKKSQANVAQKRQAVKEAEEQAAAEEKAEAAEAARSQTEEAAAAAARVEAEHAHGKAFHRSCLCPAAMDKPVAAWPFFSCVAVPS